VNTIFDVAHNAGLYTAYVDKHPAYQIANGNDPNAINDFFGPEINSTTALYDPVAKTTVDPNALLAADPFTDVSKYVLVDPSTDPVGPFDPTTGARKPVLRFAPLQQNRVGVCLGQSPAFQTRAAGGPSAHGLFARAGLPPSNPGSFIESSRPGHEFLIFVAQNAPLISFSRASFDGSRC
jgi:hypothetical protein